MNGETWFMANSDFDDIIDASITTLLDIYGVTAVYQAVAANAVSCTVFFDEELTEDPGGYEAGTWSQKKTVEGLLSDLGKEPDAGETFVIDETTYTVTNDEPENDGYSVKVVVK